MKKFVCLLAVLTSKVIIFDFRIFNVIIFKTSWKNFKNILKNRSVYKVTVNTTIALFRHFFTFLKKISRCFAIKSRPMPHIQRFWSLNLIITVLYSSLKRELTQRITLLRLGICLKSLVGNSQVTEI